MAAGAKINGQCALVDSWTARRHQWHVAGRLRSPNWGAREGRSARAHRRSISRGRRNQIRLRNSIQGSQGGARQCEKSLPGRYLVSIFALLGSHLHPVRAACLPLARSARERESARPPTWRRWHINFNSGRRAIDSSRKLAGGFSTVTQWRISPPTSNELDAVSARTSAEP